MQTICAECGGVFPVEDTIRYGNVHVCAGCKPLFMQKLSEGAAIKTRELNYAGFWIRFLAVFIDGIVLSIVRFVIGFATGLGLSPDLTPGQPAEVGAAFAQLAMIGMISIVANVIYEALFIANFAATPGKMACGLRVVTANGGKVSSGLSVGRAFAKQLSSITLLIGYIMAAFDTEKRCLHDRICDTRVIRP